jgi:glycosyltransferase involved in cell wall biosynthesis
MTISPVPVFTPKDESALLRAAAAVPAPPWGEPPTAAEVQDASPAPGSRRRISILFLVDQLTELGGGERILLHIAHHLPPDRFRVLIVTFRGEPDRLIETIPCDIRILPMSRTYGPDAMRVACKLRALIREFEIDLVHTFFETSDLFGAIVAKLCGVRAIISSRRDMGILRGAKHNLAYRLISPLYDAVLTVSDQVRGTTIRRDRLAPSKVITIHNGVPTGGDACCASGTSAFRTRHSIPEHARVVATVANVLPWKGLDVFVRCAAELHRHAPDVHFVVAGAFSDCRLTASMFALTRELCLEQHLHWIGATPSAKELLAESDVFCLLSTSEGFPNVVLEAMAAQLPVVATRVGGTPEAVVDGETGWLVAVNDHAEAAERLLELLNERALRISMGAAGLRRVHAHFTSEQMMARYIEIYERVLAGNAQESESRQ